MNKQRMSKEASKLILICGGSGSGKSTIAASYENAVVLSTDSFYHGKHKMKEPYNWDEPYAVDLDELYCKTYSLLISKSPTQIPIWSPIKQERDGYEIVRPMPLVVVEGLFAFCNLELRDLADERIFIDVPREERIKRRLERDRVKGRTPEQTMHYAVHVEEMHNKWVQPQIQYATTVIRG